MPWDSKTCSSGPCLRCARVIGSKVSTTAATAVSSTNLQPACPCRKEPHQVQCISMSGWKQRVGVWGQQRRGHSNQLPVLSRPGCRRQPGLDCAGLQGGAAWPQVSGGYVTHHSQHAQRGRGWADQAAACRAHTALRRWGHTSFVYDGQLFVYGGFDGQQNVGDMYSLDLSTCTWTRVQQRGVTPNASSGTHRSFRAAALAPACHTMLAFGLEKQVRDRKHRVQTFVCETIHALPTGCMHAQAVQEQPVSPCCWPCHAGR